MTQDSARGRHAEPMLPGDQLPAVPPQVTGEPPLPPVPPPTSEHRDAPVTVRRSRSGGIWVGLIVAALILVLLLVFILQNSQSVQIDFLWMTGRAPLAVAILLGGAAGALLVAIPGTVRIMQLRKTSRHR